VPPNPTPEPVCDGNWEVGAVGADPRNRYPSSTPSTRQNAAITYAWVQVGRGSVPDLSGGMRLSCDCRTALARDIAEALLETTQH